MNFTHLPISGQHQRNTHTLRPHNCQQIKTKNFKDSHRIQQEDTSKLEKGIPSSEIHDQIRSWEDLILLTLTLLASKQHETLRYPVDEKEKPLVPQQ